MKVYLELPTQSRGIRRVYDALIKYKPESVEVTKNYDEAELHIIHVIGRRNQVKERVEKLVAKGVPYVMIQYCLKSTMSDNTYKWLGMWINSRLVWSYYNLPQLLDEDSTAPWPEDAFPFYHAPLGVDATIFYDRDAGERDITIATCSQHALSESARECAFATKRVGGKMFHLGHELRRGDDIMCLDGISDEMLAGLYSRCKFVSGLRRVEGFEQPILEGALCGAVPIVFDRPEMRKWFNDFAIFIKEGTREQVIDQLEYIFKSGTRPVSESEKRLIREMFYWKPIITNFWNKVL